MNAIEYAEKASEVFVLSDSFIRIKELVDDEASTIDDIADVIILDPALAGTILKLANSSFFNYPGKIDTISKAVLVLGITEVYNLVIAYFTTEAFKSIDASADYLDDFWMRSVDCALLIKFFGCHLKVPNAERLFILGLLHNLGELVVKQYSPDKVVECGSEGDSELPWEKQSRILGFTYGECTAELLKLWHLPYSLMEPIRFQDDSNVESISVESNLLYIAKRVMLTNYMYNKHSFSVLLSKEQLAALDVTEELLNEAVTFCDMERLGILSLLNPSASMIY
ncbi:HDOD domain-containing protein [Colwelliaceae bacterium 6471]